MMIEVVLDPRFTGDFQTLYTHMNPVVAGALRVQASTTAIVFADGAGHRFTLTGSDLVWGRGADGKMAVLSGTADALSYAEAGRTQVTFSVLQTTGDKVWAAFQDEASGRDPGAVTALLVRHCWTYLGTDHADTFAQTVLADRGLLDPKGNDEVNLMGGDDRWFAGAANDTVRGGTGNDTIDGGADNDRLWGDAGRDFLHGGEGDDAIFGGRGDDILVGNAGNDTLDGGSGNDLLRAGSGDDSVTGGAGCDVFVFAAGSGHDVITDFEDHLDRLQITSGATIEIIAQGHDTLIRYGADEVVILGVAAGLVSLADFL